MFNYLWRMIGSIGNLRGRKHAEQALKESQQRLQALFDHTLDAILLADDQARYVDANPAAGTLTGYSREELLNRSVWDLTPAADREVKRKLWPEFIAAGKLSGEYTIIRKDGTTIEVEFVAVANILPNLHLSAIRDISERTRTEEALRRYAERLNILHGIDLAILAAQSPAAIANAALGRLRELISCPRASITVFDFETEEAIVLAMDTDHETRLRPGMRFALATTGFSDLDKLRQGQAQVVEDIRLLTSPPPMVQTLQTEGLCAYLNVPLVAQDELIGTLNLAREESGGFPENLIKLTREVANQLAIAIQHARLFEQVQTGRQQLQVLSRRLLEAQEAERRHLAHELHDEIGQALTAVKISLQTTQRLSRAPTITAHLQDSMGIVDNALQQVRNLSLDLRPSLLDDLGLVAALRWYLDRQAQRARFTARMIADPLESRPPPAVETACFRVAQEALTNIVRHAQAQWVHVEVRRRGPELQLVIRDDGVGFTVRAARERALRGESLGLLGMEERTLLAGGRLDIKSAPGQGATIRAHFPLTPDLPFVERRLTRRS